MYGIGRQDTTSIGNQPAKLISFNAKLISFNAKLISFNAKFLVLNFKKYSFLIQTSSFLLTFGVRAGDRLRAAEREKARQSQGKARRMARESE